MKERNFIKIKNYMFAVSAVVLLLGIILYIFRDGFRYGIDFQGGSQLQVSLGESSSVSDLQSVLGNEVNITRIDSEQSDQFLIKVAIGRDISSEDIKVLVNNLIASLGEKYPNLKLSGDIRSDSNSVNFALAFEEGSILTDGMAVDELRKYLGGGSIQVEKAEDGKSFLVSSSISQFVAEKKVIEPLEASFKNLSIDNSTSYDPTQGEHIKGQALKVSLLILVLILLYIGLRFKFRFGVAAVIALLHDMLIVVSVLLFFDRELDITTVVALLTIMGYSLNDTIVVFDRIRENQKLLTVDDYVLVVNKSISQSLSRTLVTSLTTLFVVFCILVIGGPALENLSFSLFIGVIVGTYSSIFIASPVLVIWDNIIVSRTQKKPKKNNLSKGNKVLA